MTSNEKTKQWQTVVGQPLDRVDGRLKVTGGAHYPAEFALDNLAHAVIVQSTIAAGRIKNIDTSSVTTIPGVRAILTHHNMPRLHIAPPGPLGNHAPPPLQDDRIYYNGQHVAIIVADTFEQATFAATRLVIDYEEETPCLTFEDQDAEWLVTPDVVRGEPEAALATAAVRVDERYSTPMQHHNPMALFATIASWEGDQLLLHDTTQGTENVRTVLAAMLGLMPEKIRVIAPFIGGAFGSGLRCWPHVPLVALAARQVGRPVKLVLTREQMFTSIGYRPPTIQRVALGATNEGQLVAAIHEGDEPTAMADDYREGLVRAIQSLYATPNLRASFRQTRLNVSTPTWMRGPGESQGVFALETALDELAYALHIDPVELRIRNDAQVHPESGRPWSSRGLRESYEQGAKRFGWEQRNHTPRSMRDGNDLIGWGVASGFYPYNRREAAARVRICADGNVLLQTGATDIGTGTATIMVQIAADALGISPHCIHCELGDSALPVSPSQGGSMLAASVGSAVHIAATEALTQILTLLHDDESSPLRGATTNEVVVHNGSIALRDDPRRYETYGQILQRHGRTEIVVQGSAAPGDETQQFATGTFGAKFAEVRVDADLGRIRVSRVLSVIASGRILNEKTARSQVIGGTVGGIGMALLEQTFMHPQTGRIINDNLADYVLPVHADIPASIDVLFIDQPDTHLNPIGVKGVGELAIVGIAPAIGNAIYHATGKRIRDLPITMDKLL